MRHHFGHDVVPFYGSVSRDILLLKGDFGSPFKSKIPPFLGRDLGGPCTEEVMKREHIYVRWLDADSLHACSSLE